MVTTKSDLASRVANRVDDVPLAMTSTVIQEFIEDSHIEVENYTGDTFVTSDIPTRYQPILVDMATIKVLEYMVTHNVSMGGISISAGERGGIKQKIMGIQERIDKAMINLLRTEGFSTTTEPEETEDA